MKTLAKAVVVLAMSLAPAAALAQDYEDGYADEAPPAEAQPTSPAPDLLPPPPPAVTSAPVAQAPVVQAPAGQWTYTSQYGWIFLPYDQAYTYVPADGSYPLVYAYSPVYGWHWLTAPWVYSVGPRPYWGVYGYARFAWYTRPWFTVPSHYFHHRSHWHYRAAPVRGHGWGHAYRHEPSRHHAPAPTWHGGARPHGGGMHQGGGRPPSAGHSSPGHFGGRPGGGGQHGGGTVHQARPAGPRR